MHKIQPPFSFLFPRFWLFLVGNLLPLAFFSAKLQAQPIIAWQVAPQLDTAVTFRLAWQDVDSLLRKATGRTGPSAAPASVRLVVEAPRADAFPPLTQPNFDVFAEPDSRFEWESRAEGSAIVLLLKSASPLGAANGLYALLQEKLGFAFLHPRQTFIPDLRQGWPLPAEFVFAGAPQFRHRGFHIHTQHPLELTEQLHRADFPGAWDDLKTYIDWLARNGQNAFQYYLLRKTPKEGWGQLMNRMVRHAHSRGIRCGLKLSYHSIQQRAYQLVPHHKRGLSSLQKQVDKSLAHLFQAPWDYISSDLSLAEFLRGLGKHQDPLVRYTQDVLWARYKARFFYNTHVIQNDNTYGKAKGDNPHLPRLPLRSEEAAANPTQPRASGPLDAAGQRVPEPGVLLHSVMCYSVTEPKAPVYGNENQRFMYDYIAQQAPRRESWYFPESAYWVTFDNTVPLWLMPYLSARLSDMDSLAPLGVTGHVTFSSGWEWGYWAVDWSIARWAWRYTTDLQPHPRTPTAFLEGLFNRDTTFARGLKASLLLQEYYFKEKELLRFVSASNPLDEVPAKYAKPFQPRPAFRYGYLARKAPLALLDSVVDHVLNPLLAFAERQQTVLNYFVLPGVGQYPADDLRSALARELAIALQLTVDRALHRRLTLDYIIHRRARQLGAGSATRARADSLMARAQQLRQRSLLLVREQERHFRYSVTHLTTKRPSVTAYEFGYLYLPHRLWFWEREEIQARRKSFNPLVRNTWDFGRILGLW